MDNEKFLELIDTNFGVHKHNDCVDLETWTTGGVNMHITIHIDSEQTYLEQFKEYVLDFEVDEQIDLHREGEAYKNTFTIRQSLKDFESYEELLQSILSRLEEHINQ
ncbi:hypothetical protein [Priestia aryabhattai]